MPLLNVFWLLLAPILAHLGVKMACVGASLAHLGASLGDLGAHLPTTCYQVAHMMPKSASQTLANIDSIYFGTDLAFLAAVSDQAAPEKDHAFDVFFSGACAMRRAARKNTKNKARIGTTPLLRNEPQKNQSFQNCQKRMQH